MEAIRLPLRRSRLTRPFARRMPQVQLLDATSAHPRPFLRPALFVPHHPEYIAIQPGQRAEILYQRWAPKLLLHRAASSRRGHTRTTNLLLFALSSTPLSTYPLANVAGILSTSNTPSQSAL